VQEGVGAIEVFKEIPVDLKLQANLVTTPIIDIASIIAINMQIN